MASATYRLAGASLRPEPVMPPGFALHTLRELGDAFAHAIRLAPAEGAGTLVWTRRFDLVEWAVVLEPAEPLATARLAHYLGMNALADALATVAPPERELVFGWPDAILFDGGLLGGGRSAWPEGTAEDAVPDWFVFGAMLRLSTLQAPLPGMAVPVTMEDEGFELDPAGVVESFARHLMLGVDEWLTRGAKAVVRRYLDRIPREPGLRRAIGPAGELIGERNGLREAQPLASALAAPAWLAADGTAPRL
jgi:hypothetical protein